MRPLSIIGAVLLLIGLIVAALGVYLGLSGVSRLNTSCGTGFGGVEAGVAQMDRERVEAAQQKQDESDLFDALTGQQYGNSTSSSSEADPHQLANACEPAVDSRRTTALVVLVPGAAVAVGGVIVLGACGRAVSRTEAGRVLS